jgi:hypothetical protein
MRARSRVYDVKGFVDWFKRQVGGEMGCRDVDITAVGVHAGGALVVFKCGGKKYLAEIKVSRRFRVSVYVPDYRNGSLIRIKKLRLRGEPFKVYDARFGVNSDNALFYVADGVNIDVYEYQPHGGAILEPRDY